MCAALIFVPAPNLAYKKLRVFVLVPPEQTLGGVKTIAVTSFNGDAEQGAAVADRLVMALLDEQRGITDVQEGNILRRRTVEGRTLQTGATTKAFDVIERTRLASVLSEQQLGASGVIDDAAAARVGMVLGADALVLGTITLRSADAQFRETHEYTVNKQKYQRVVNCWRREVRLSVRARVVASETGRILGSTEVAGDAHDKTCEDDNGTLANAREMAEALAPSTANALANYLAPRFELREFELEKIKNKKLEALGEKAAALAEDLRVDEAFAIYKSIHEQDQYSPEVMYNLAVLHEVVGNYRQAHELYGMALQLDQKDDYQRGIARCERGMALREALARVGVNLEEHIFGAIPAPTGAAEEVEIKGRREDRVPIYASPSTNAEVVAQVPGGVRFPLVSRDGEWYRVRLLGGKEGYVHVGQVKR
jgi:curli biogenesis system outer membrane secretion channel CsgG